MLRSDGRELVQASHQPPVRGLSPRLLRNNPQRAGRSAPYPVKIRRISDNPAPSPWHGRCPLGGMITRERVEAVLNKVRPFMQADGGDIELVDLEGNSAGVRLTGMCAGCPSAHMTLYVGVENALREEIPEFETLRLL
jgi:Fe-S cluster biogenesis protein NfuA